jgi:hypothetical protein
MSEQRYFLVSLVLLFGMEWGVGLYLRYSVYTVDIWMILWMLGLSIIGQVTPCPLNIEDQSLCSIFVS